MKCALCRRGKTRPTEHRERLSVAGHEFTALLPAEVCDACGEVTIDGPAIGRFELAAARALMDAGETSGEAFRFARKTLALTAVETATLLGTTPETISRWETGKRGVDSAAMAVLAVLVRDATNGSTANLDMLRARRGAKRLPKRVALKLAS
jgi:putative zinc finger/helix-turn-helix YgiT family protein